MLNSERVTVESVIPEYILRALAFACQETIDERSLKLMGLYRIRSADDTELDVAALNPQLDELVQMTPSDFVERYLEECPEDQLAEFIGYLKENEDGD